METKVEDIENIVIGIDFDETNPSVGFWNWEEKKS